MDRLIRTNQRFLIEIFETLKRGITCINDNVEDIKVEQVKLTSQFADLLDEFSAFKNNFIDEFVALQKSLREKTEKDFTQFQNLSKQIEMLQQSNAKAISQISEAKRAIQGISLPEGSKRNQPNFGTITSTKVDLDWIFPEIKKKKDSKESKDS